MYINIIDNYRLKMMLIYVFLFMFLGSHMVSFVFLIFLGLQLKPFIYFNIILWVNLVGTLMFLAQTHKVQWALRVGLGPPPPCYATSFLYLCLLIGLFLQNGTCKHSTMTSFSMLTSWLGYSTWAMKVPKELGWEHAIYDKDWKMMCMSWAIKEF